MTEPPDDEYADHVDRIVNRAQQLDAAKERFREEIRAEGRDPDESRIIIGYRTDDGGYDATEVQRPGWMNNRPDPTA
jgi:hypothetical protein